MLFSPSTIGNEPICSQFSLPAHALSSAVLCAFLVTCWTAFLHFTLWRDLIFSPLLKGCERSGQETTVHPGLVASQPQGWTWKRLACGPPSCLLRASRSLPVIWGREATHQNATDLTVKRFFSMSNLNFLCCNLSKLCTFLLVLACVNMQSKSFPSSSNTCHFLFSFPFLDQITPITSAFSQRKITSPGGCILILQQCNDCLYYSRMSSVTLWQATATFGSFFAEFFSNSSFSVCTVCYSCQSFATCIRPY